MKRLYLILLLVAIACLSLFDADIVDAICYNLVLSEGNSCDQASRLESAGPTFVEPTQPEDSPLNNYWIGRLVDFTPVYAEPSLIAPVIRNVGDGFLYVTIYRQLEVEGQTWYEINYGEYVEAANLDVVSISEFKGVEIVRQPQRPFGWIIVDFRPSLVPGDEPDYQFEKLARYTFIEIYDAVEDDEGWIWYDIGNGMWINQKYVSLVDVSSRPTDVGPNEKWTEVDLYEQTFAAYEGDRMVYATLISTGLNNWPTYEGVFRVRYRHEATTMSGAEGKVDYYLVEDVPHTMFFDIPNEIALHGAYWHDRFGYKHSHGCVNMPPLDAEWVFNWSADTAPINTQATDDEGLWVWVHTSDPQNYLIK